jgi:hypothetical protein
LICRLFPEDFGLSVPSQATDDSVVPLERRRLIGLIP